MHFRHGFGAVEGCYLVGFVVDEECSAAGTEFETLACCGGEESGECGEGAFLMLILGGLILSDDENRF